MRKVPLTNGESALVDDDDYERLSAFAWTKTPNGYALRRHRGITYYMHREVMGLVHGEAVCVDHINAMKLDNRRANLRLATWAKNIHCGKSRPNTTGYRGVCKIRSGYLAQIRVNGKRKHLGVFETPELAHEFYCLAADMLHGEFANHG